MEPSSPISEDNKLPELFDFVDAHLFSNDEAAHAPVQENLEDHLLNFNDENDNYEVPQGENQEIFINTGDDNNDTTTEEPTEPPEDSEEDKREQGFEGLQISDLSESIIVNQELFPDEYCVSDLSAQVCAEFQHRLYFTHKHKIGKHGAFAPITYGVSSTEGFMSENFIMLFRKCNQLEFYFPSSTLVGRCQPVIHIYEIRDTFSPCEVRIISTKQNQADQSLIIEIENVIPNSNNNNSDNNNNNDNGSSSGKKSGRGNAVHPNVFILHLEDEIGSVASFYIFAYRRSRGTNACSKKARKYINANPFPDVIFESK